jgi:hypothetical protein
MEGIKRQSLLAEGVGCKRGQFGSLFCLVTKKKSREKEYQKRNCTKKSNGIRRN